MKKILSAILYLLAFTFSFSSCKKLVEIESPTNSVSSINIYNNNETAVGAITSLYANLSVSGLNTPGELTSLSCVAGLSADELSYYNSSSNTGLAPYYKNNLTNLNIGNFSNYWGISYNRIYLVNSALEGLIASKDLNPNIKTQLIGEARFMRAFYYFYLVNLYGDIPLVLSTDYTINSLISKSSISQVYQQIVLDLKEAQNLLSSQYIKGDGMNVYASTAEERVRPTKWAATALLARVYLFEKNWSEAERQSTLVLDNSNQYRLVSLNEVFLKNNQEAIWQLQPIMAGYNSQEANIFVLTTAGPSLSKPVYLNDRILSVFEAGDHRKSDWVGSVLSNGKIYYFPNKYKIVRSSDPSSPTIEYSTVLRLAEQYLIRAEARARQGNLDGAISDVDRIRNRAGLLLIKNITPNILQNDLISAIQKERRLELLSEWGHRWFDMKRTLTVDDVMTIETPKKANGNTWEKYQQYYPISVNELKSNPNLVQNEGY